MKRARIGLVGLGRLGYVHALNITRSTKAQLVGVCDLDAARVTHTAEELETTGFADIHAMLADQDLDAVCVATPTAAHVEPVSAVVRAGLPLFLEKPLADNIEDSQKLAALIRDHGVPCQLGFQRRFDPDFHAAYELIRNGEIGTPVYICGFSRDPVPPPSWARDPAKGGGLYIDFLLHDFDMARFLMDDEVETVFAAQTNLVVDSGGIEGFADNATVTLRFRRGGLATFHASMHASYGYDIRTEVFGSNGNLIIGGLNKNRVTVCSPAKGITRPDTFHSQGRLPHFMLRFREAYEREIEAFVDTIIGGVRPLADQDDGLRAFAVALAAEKSARTQQPVPPEIFL